eukprot:2530246-Amphidinium_carterae.1
MLFSLGCEHIQQSVLALAARCVQNTVCSDLSIGARSSSTRWANGSQSLRIVIGTLLQQALITWKAVIKAVGP